MAQLYVQVIFPNGDETSSRRKADGVWTIDKFVDEFHAANAGLFSTVHYGPATFGHVSLFLAGDALVKAEADGGAEFDQRRTIDLRASV